MNKCGILFNSKINCQQNPISRLSHNTIILNNSHSLLVRWMNKNAEQFHPLYVDLRILGDTSPSPFHSYFFHSNNPLLQMSFSSKNFKLLKLWNYSNFKFDFVKKKRRWYGTRDEVEMENLNEMTIWFPWNYFIEFFFLGWFFFIL